MQPAGRVVAGLLPLSDAVRRGAQRLLKSSQAVPFVIGKDYDVLTVSFDPRETPAWPREKKAALRETYRRPGRREGWHFLVGDRRRSSVGRVGRFSLSLRRGIESVCSRRRALSCLTPEGQRVALFLRNRLSADEICGWRWSKARRARSVRRSISSCCFVFITIRSRADMGWRFRGCSRGAASATWRPWGRFCS